LQGTRSQPSAERLPRQAIRLLPAVSRQTASRSRLTILIAGEPPCRSSPEPFTSSSKRSGSKCTANPSPIADTASACAHAAPAPPSANRRFCRIAAGGVRERGVPTVHRDPHPPKALRRQRQPLRVSLPASRPPLKRGRQLKKTTRLRPTGRFHRPSNFLLVAKTCPACGSRKAKRPAGLATAGR